MDRPMNIAIEAERLSPPTERLNNLVLSLDSIPPESPVLSSPKVEHQTGGGGRLEDFDPEEEDRKALDAKNPDIAISGYVYKRTDSGGNWKKRWMVLCKGGPIFYYDSLKSEEPSGVLYLVNASVFEKIQFNGFVDPKSFGVRVDGKDFLLKAKTEEQKVAWCQAIDENITTEVAHPKKAGEKAGKKGKKKGPVSGSFYSSGDVPSDEDVHPFAANAQGTSSEDSSSEDDDEDEDEEEQVEDDSETEIEGEQIIMESTVEILKDAAKQIWTKRHLILERDGSLFLYREQSDYPCDMIKVKESSLYTRVDQRGREMSDAFNLRYNKKNYIIRGEKREQWINAIKSLIPQNQGRRGSFAEIEILKEQNRRMSDFEVSDP